MILTNPNLKIFAGSGSQDFAKKICDYLDLELGKSKVIKFSEGNTFVRVDESVRDKDVYIVQSIGMKPNDEFVEMLFWMDAFKRSSAKSVTAIIPYFGYAKGDKEDEPRVSIRARVCADCLEMAGADRIITMDLHSPQIQGFFKKPVDHLFALPVLCEYIKSLNLENFTIVSPDTGFAKEARKFASYLGTNIAIADKVRKDHNENAEILDIIGNVEGKDVVIVDDFTISGGTIVETAKALKEQGANRVFACLSHVLLNERGIKKLEDSPIERLVTTDSINNPVLKKSKKIKTLSVAPLFAEVIERIHHHSSVSPLSNTLPRRVVENSMK